MANRPPRWIKTPAQIALDRRERARRYKARGKPTVRGAWLAAIRLAELTRWLDHINGAGVELDPHDRNSETIVRVFVHHFVGLKDGSRRAADWMATYCPWFTLRSRESLITEACHCTIHWTADRLAWKLGVRDALRTELELTTIGAIDVTKAQRAQRRKAMQAAAQRALRAKRKADRVTTI
jgi:hypothetical protein